MTFLMVGLLLAAGVLIISGLEGHSVAQIVQQFLGGKFYVKSPTSQ